MRAVDVNRVLEDTLGLVEYELKKGKVEAELALARDAPPAWGDGEKLKQVVLNLVVNATHAMPEGGRLEVRTFGPGAAPAATPGDGDRWSSVAVGEAPAGPVLNIQIADHGTGIQPGTLASIFEPFFSTKGEGKGTGLGLYIARNIILEHRGRMEVASATGQGTVFTITLPTAEGEGTPENAVAHAVPGAATVAGPTG